MPALERAIRGSSSGRQRADLACLKSSVQSKTWREYSGRILWMQVYRFVLLAIAASIMRILAAEAARRAAIPSLAILGSLPG